MYHLIMCQVIVWLSSYHQCFVIIVWLSWCYCESSVPYLEHQKASQKDRQRSLHQRNRPPTAYVIIKSMVEK